MLLGEISPKIKTAMVITAVEMVAPFSSNRPMKYTVPIDAKEMFTMLLPIKMVEISLS